MTDQAPARVRLPWRFVEWHPLWFLVGGPFVTLLSVVTYVWLRRLARGMAIGNVMDGLQDCAIVAIGLAGGFAGVFIHRRWIHRGCGLENSVRALAFGERIWPVRGLGLLSLVVPWSAAFGVLYLLCGSAWIRGFLLFWGALYAPLPFLYHSNILFYDRARQVFMKAAVAQGQAAPEGAARSSPHARAWGDAVGAIVVVGMLAMGAWLQWGLPRVAK